MSKKVLMVSDVTGNDITSHVQVTIHKPDHGFKLGDTTYFGVTTLDVDESELPDMLKALTFVPSGSSKVHEALSNMSRVTENYASPGAQGKS